MKNRWWLVFLAVVSLNLVHALASERLDEMVEAIEEQVEDAEEQADFIEAVEAYIEARDEALDRLVGLIAATGEAEQENTWISIIDDLSDIPELSDVDDDLASEAALELYDQFMDEEQAWVSALSVLETAAYRDILVHFHLRLATMTQLLEDKWQGLLDDDGQLDEKQYKVMADIYGILAQLARESDTKRQSVRNGVQIVTDLATKVDVLPGNIPSDFASAIKDLLSLIAEAAKQYNNYRTTFETLRPQLQELAGQELGLLIIFNDTRRDTQIFVEENGFDIMKALYGDAEDELEAFADMGTDGQQDDADAFVAEVLEALSDHVAEGENRYNSFVAKHNLKFFGPVGPDIKEYLAETKTWLAEADKVERLDLEDFLSAWRSDANSFFGVNLSVDGITDYERDFIREQLEGDLKALQKAIDEAGAAFSSQNLSLIYDRRTIEDALK